LEDGKWEKLGGIPKVEKRLLQHPVTTRYGRHDTEFEKIDKQPGSGGGWEGALIKVENQLSGFCGSSGMRHEI
jgi:hypothetical protein